MLDSLARVRLVRFEVAIDWTASTRLVVGAVARRLLDSVTIPRRRSTHFAIVGNSHYFRPAGDGFNACLYFDKPSRRHTDFRPCCHFEIRAIGFTTIKRAGITTPSDLARLDLSEFLQRRIRPIAIDFERLGRQLSFRRLTKRTAINKGHAFAGMYDFVAQRIVDEARSRGIRSARFSTEIDLGAVGNLRKPWMVTPRNVNSDHT
ncbi:MAG: hypothetical protein QM770_24660 [Tepidisphaeraceae bacterium]